MQQCRQCCCFLSGDSRTLYPPTHFLFLRPVTPLFASRIRLNMFFVADKPWGNSTWDVKLLDSPWTPHGGGYLSHPHLFHFLPALVRLGVARFALVSAQRGFQQAPLEPRVTESIRIRPAIASGRLLRSGLGPGPGPRQLLLCSAPGEPLLVGLWRQRRFAA